MEKAKKVILAEAYYGMTPRMNKITKSLIAEGYLKNGKLTAKGKRAVSSF